jgi:hypothetical protein
MNVAADAGTSEFGSRLRRDIALGPRRIAAAIWREDAYGFVSHPSEGLRRSGRARRPRRSAVSFGACWLASGALASRNEPVVVRNVSGLDVGQAEEAAADPATHCALTLMVSLFASRVTAASRTRYRSCTSGVRLECRTCRFRCLLRPEVEVTERVGV